MNTYLESGTNFLKEGTPFVIENVIGCTEMLTARNLKSKYQFSISIGDFLHEYETGLIKITKNGTEVAAEMGDDKCLPNRHSEKEIDEALQIKQWIEACVDENGMWISNESARKAQLFDFARSKSLKGKLPSARNLRRLYARWKANGKSLDSLVPRTKRRGNRSDRLPNELKAFIEANINEFYMSTTRPSISGVHRIIKEKIENEVEYSHLQIPSRSTVERMIHTISKYDQCVAREGWQTAKSKFPYGSPVIQPSFLMQKVEIDHTPINLKLRCANRKEVIATVWLTVVIESVSRMIVGYYLAPHEPSAISVIRALKFTVMSKDNILATLPELAGYSWPCWGLPAEISMDNGSDLLSKMVLYSLAQLGIDTHFNPKGRPNFKGKVERFQGTANRQPIEFLPGRTFSNYIEKGDYKAEKNAVITFEDLEKIFLIWVVKIYHQTEHRGIKEKPIDTWNRLKVTAPPIRLAPCADFEKFLWKREEKTLQTYGVEANTFRYQSIELQKIAKQIGHGSVVEVFIDQNDISVVHVRVPGSNDYVDAFAPRSDYMDLKLNMDDHLSAVKCAGEMFKDANGRPRSATRQSPTQMLAGWNEILRISEEALKSSKKATRAKEVKRQSKNAAKYPKKSDPKSGVLTNHQDEQPITPNLEDL